MRLSEDRWAWLTAEARRRGTTRTGVVRELIDAAREVERVRSLAMFDQPAWSIYSVGR